MCHLCTKGLQVRVPARAHASLQVPCPVRMHAEATDGHFSPPADVTAVTTPCPKHLLNLLLLDGSKRICLPPHRSQAVTGISEMLSTQTLTGGREMRWQNKAPRCKKVVSERKLET